MKKRLALILCMLMALNAVLMTGCGADVDPGPVQITADDDGGAKEDEPAATDVADETATEDEANAAEDKDATADTDTSDDAQTADDTDAGDGSDASNEANAGNGQGEYEMSDGITMPEMNIPQIKVPETESFAFLDAMGVGFKGGQIVPAFFIGSTLGCTLAGVVGLDPAVGAAVGMIAVFSGVVRCPFAALVMSIEIFGPASLPIFILACGLEQLAIRN